MNKTISLIAWILLIIGGINWGLIGILDFNLISAIVGEMSLISKIIYSLVGISAIFGIIDIFD